MLHEATVSAEPPAPSHQPIEIEPQVELHDQFVEVTRTGTSTEESRNGKRPSHLRPPIYVVVSDGIRICIRCDTAPTSHKYRPVRPLDPSDCYYAQRLRLSSMAQSLRDVKP